MVRTFQYLRELNRYEDLHLFHYKHIFKGFTPDIGLQREMLR